MKLFKFFKGMVVITALSVIYINLQMQIFDLAYQAKRKEKEIHRLIDQTANFTYHILTLKSANHLGGALLSEKSDMQFVDNRNVVNLQAPVLKTEPAAQPQKTEKKPNLLANLFSLRSQAEAKPIE